MTKILALEEVAEGATVKRVVFVDGVRLPPNAAVAFTPSPAVPGHTAWEWDEQHHRALPSVDVEAKWENCNFMSFQKPHGVDFTTWVDHMQATQFRQEKPQAHWVHAGDGEQMLSFTGVVNGPMEPGAFWGTIVKPEDVLKVIPVDVLREHLEKRRQTARAAHASTVVSHGGCRMASVEVTSTDRRVKATAVYDYGYWTLTGWTLVRGDDDQWNSEVEAYVDKRTPSFSALEVPDEVLDGLERIVLSVKKGFEARQKALRDLVQAPGLSFNPPDDEEDDEEDEEGF